MDDDERLAGTFELRDGVMTRAELHDLGVTDARIHWLVARKRWQLVLPGVVLLSSAPPTRRQQLVSALLLGGPDAVVGGPAAARFHGVRSIPPTGPVHVLAPRSRARRRHLWADVRPTRLEDPEVVETSLLRYSSIPRAVVDAARWAPTQQDADARVIEAVQRRLTGPVELASWVNRLNRRDSARARRALEAAASGVWSIPEAEVVELMAGSRLLPAPWLNPHLEDATGHRLLTPDLWLDDVAMAVMVHSQQFHDGPGQWDRTVAEDAELGAHGVVVVGVTPRSLRREAAVVLDRIERAYRVARTRPRPGVRATPRSALAA